MLEVYQGSSPGLFVRLLSTASLPVDSLLFSDVTVKVRSKTDLVGFEKALTADNFVFVSNGWYLLTLDENECSALGELLVEITGGAIAPTYAEVNVLVTPLQVIASPGLCVVSGNIIDITGVPGIGDVIYFNSVAGPIYAGNSFLKSTAVETNVDAYGNFSIGLIRGAKVRVSLPKVGINIVVTIPNQESVLLKDLLPPVV